MLFNPEPDIKLTPFGLELHKRGHSVEILTGFPNYPGGKIYEGFSLKTKQIDYKDGLKIIRVPWYLSHDGSATKRVVTYISMAISMSIMGPFLIQRPDVIYVYHPPATVAIPSILLKLIYRAPIVYDIQDLWPDTLKATGMLKSTLMLKAIGTYCKLCYKLVDHIAVLSHGFKRILISRNVKKDKITVVHN